VVPRRAEDANRLVPAGLDRLLEHRTRLAACVLLSRHERMSFTRLRELTDETDGNLGAHLRKLEDERYLTTTKEFVERRPVSWYRLTAEGRKRLGAHLEALDAIIRKARRG
jgi:DNA-binding PadR family transcriptional regulator